MSGKQKHYFACANSSKGFVNFFDSNLHGLQKIYVLIGGPGTGKSTLMKRVAAKYIAKNYEVEYIHCSSDPDSLDGVIVRTLGFGIVDGTSPHIVEPKAPGAIEEYVNLGVAWNVTELESKTQEILVIQKEITSYYTLAYIAFEEALRIHDEWEKIYLDHMDFEKANELAEHIISLIFKENRIKESQVSRHRFFGGSTPKGVMDYVKDLIADCETRYFIKGRAGTGKSTMLKKILAKAEEKGIDCEVYHCGFDPNSLDMLLFPELSICIFDSTAPHEYYPNREDDCIVDLYEELVEKGTDEMHEKELRTIALRYQKQVTEGIGYLKKAKKLHDELEEIYMKATDFKKVNLIENNLMKKIDTITLEGELKS